MSPPLVSVLIATYNQREYVREAVLSAVEQDYPNLEVIVTDDGSTDGTADVLREIAAAHPGRVTAIVDEPHVGITANCNRGLRRCRGTFVALCAGDDNLHPRKIAEQVAWFERKPEGVICGHDVEIFLSETNESLGLFSKISPMRSGRGADYWIENTAAFPPISMMIRASALPRWGYDDRLRIASDWKLWIDCLAAGGEYGYVEGVLARYRRHERSVLKTPSMDRYTDAFATLGIVESDYPHLARTVARARRRWYITKAMAHLRLGQREHARRYVRLVLRGWMLLHWKTYVAAALAYAPPALAAKIASRRSAVFR